MHVLGWGVVGLEIQNALSVYGPISSQLPCSRILFAHSHVLDAGQHDPEPTHQLKGMYLRDEA